MSETVKLEENILTSISAEALLRILNLRKIFISQPPFICTENCYLSELLFCTLLERFVLNIVKSLAGQLVSTLKVSCGKERSKRKMCS